MWTWFKCCADVTDLEDEPEVSDSVPKTDESGGFNFRWMVHRDKRRWARADVDGDGELSKEEFAAFVHPEDAEHMRDIIVDVRFNLLSVFLTYN